MDPSGECPECGGAIQSIRARKERPINRYACRSQHGGEEESAAAEPNKYRRVPDQPYPCERSHGSKGDRDLEEGDAVGEPVMQMQQIPLPHNQVQPGR